MSTVTKSTDPRYAGRRYEAEDDTYYQQRVSYAEKLKAEGNSHKRAWFQAFQAYPRVYVDAPNDAPPPSPANAGASNFVFPPGL
jgi:hypothetical protein